MVETGIYYYYLFVVYIFIINILFYSWKVEDVQYDKSQDTFDTVITRLRPYTQYAYYIKAFTISNTKIGGQTDIHYFRTLSDKPGNMKSLTASSNSSSEIVMFYIDLIITPGLTYFFIHKQTINWEPPRKTNGNITKFIIEGTLVSDDAQLLGQRNYCTERK